MDNQVREVVETESSSSSSLGIVILFGALYLLYQWLFVPDWTLFVCEDLLREGYRYECGDILAVQHNTYHSEELCKQLGEDVFSYAPGYECGYKCDFDAEWNAWVCKE